MRESSSLSVEQREAAVAWFERGWAYRAVSTEMQVSRWAVRDLYRRWRIRGRGAIVEKPDKQSFSFEFKLAAVERVLGGDNTAVVAGELELSSPSLLRRWVQIHRREGPEGLRPKPKGRPRRGDSPPAPLTELEKLRRENARLKAENAYLGKLRALREQER